MEENKWNKTNQWENELEQLHAIIRKTPLVETTKWGGPVYTYNNKNVLGIGGFKSYFGIWFYNGVFLKDEKKLLINANEENTKSLRQMRFNSANEIDEKKVETVVITRDCFAEAIDFLNRIDPNNQLSDQEGARYMNAYIASCEKGKKSISAN